MPKVALIMGSKSDAPSLAGCVKILRAFGVEVEVHVTSAHRTPEKVAAFADHARENGFSQHLSILFRLRIASELPVQAGSSVPAARCSHIL